jgi:hypothetical protein
MTQSAGDAPIALIAFLFLRRSWVMALAGGGHSGLYPSASQFPEERCDDGRPVVHRGQLKPIHAVSARFAVIGP